jgi:hypothetical protein
MVIKLWCWYHWCHMPIMMPNSCFAEVIMFLKAGLMPFLITTMFFMSGDVFWGRYQYKICSVMPIYCLVQLASIKFMLRDYHVLWYWYIFGSCTTGTISSNMTAYRYHVLWYQYLAVFFIDQYLVYTVMLVPVSCPVIPVHLFKAVIRYISLCYSTCQKMLHFYTLLFSQCIQRNKYLKVRS